MTTKQIVLILVALAAIGLASVVAVKLFARVPEIEDTQMGTSAAFWAEDPAKKLNESVNKYWGWK